MSLREELAAQRQRAEAGRGAEERAARESAIREVKEAGLAAKALGVGEPIPEINLPDVTGRPIRVNDFLHAGPVIISFYRGGWCPYCNLELRALQRYWPDLQEPGATLFAISPEAPDHLATTGEEEELSFPLLWDRDNVVAHEFRLVHRISDTIRRYQLGRGNDVAAVNHSSVAEVPLPASYVVDQQGTVRFAFVDADYRHRADPEALVSAARQLLNGT